MFVHQVALILAPLVYIYYSHFHLYSPPYHPQPSLMVDTMTQVLLSSINTVLHFKAQYQYQFVSIIHLSSSSSNLIYIQSSPYIFFLSLFSFILKFSLVHFTSLYLTLPLFQNPWIWVGLITLPYKA